MQHAATVQYDLTPATIPVARPRLPMASAILPYLEQIDDNRWYSNFGPLLQNFEARLAARFQKAVQIVTMVNATQGLTLALKAMQLPVGGLCAMPAWTFVATAHAVVEAGLTPWFVDVDADSWMLDPHRLKADLAKAPGEVCAVVPVAAFGQMPDLDAWRTFRAETGMAVLIDAAAAFDTAHDGDLPMVISLHATKVLGIGEGGFLATTDIALAERVRQLTTYGFSGSREARLPATNAKLSEYAAAVGLAAMDGWPADRLRFARAAQMLRMALAQTPQVEFQSGWGTAWVTSVCVARLPEGSTEAVEAALALAGVDTRRWWGHGCHRDPAFQHFPRRDLTVTRALAGRTLGLPFALDLSLEAVDRIAMALGAATGAQAPASPGRQVTSAQAVRS